MKKMVKYSNRFGIVLALCVMVISGCSCSAPKPTANPLAGWHYSHNESVNSHKIIVDDYKAYIQTLSPNEKNYARVNGFYGDGTGQHAVRIEIDLDGTAWFHDLIYDKDDKRIKSIKHVGYYYAS